MTETSRSRPVVFSTIIVMGGIALSILLGLIRSQLIGAAFGTSLAADAYFAANGIPETLFNVLSSGTLTFAFLPVFSQLLHLQDNKTSASQLFSRVLNSMLLLIIVASVLVAIYADVLVSAPWGVAPHFDAPTRALTVQLMRIWLISTVIFAISSFITGVLHAHQHFWLPALSPAFYNLGIIFGVSVFATRLGWGISGVTWGAVLGSLLHLLIQLPGVFRFRVRWMPLFFNLSDPHFRQVALLMAPRIADLFMARASINWINSNLGASLGEGRISALSNAYTLMNMPWTMIGTAIGIAIFPTLTKLAAQDDQSGQKQALSGAIRAVLVLALPAAAALIMLGKPIIRILFLRGAFDENSLALVYWALQFYALTMISQSLLDVVVRAFAARQDTLTPLLVSVFTTLVNLALSIWFVRTWLVHGGLPLANAIAVGIEVSIGLFLINRRWQIVDTSAILSAGLKAGIAALGMSAAIWGIIQLGWGSLPTLAVGALAGGLVYLTLAVLFGIREVVQIPLELLRIGKKQTHEE